MKSVAHLAIPIFGLFALTGCESERSQPKSETTQPKTEVDEFWVFEDAYKSGLPVEKWKKWPFCLVQQRSFKGVPIAVVQVSQPNSYGNTFHLRIYYKANKDDVDSRDWRECLRFSARSYWELKVVFDESEDQLTILGVVPSDKSKEKLLVRRRFHHSFTYYIPEHG